MKRKNALIGGLFAAIIIGCGGGTDITSGFPDPDNRVVLPTGPGIDGGSITRTFRAGDVWEYDVTGTMLREVFDDAEEIQSKMQGPVSGRMVRTFTAATVNGTPVFKVTDSLSYAINGGLTWVENTESYVRQEVDGSVTILGRREQHTDTFNGTGRPWIPGNWAAGANVGGQRRFLNTPEYQDAFFDISTSLAATGSTAVQSTSSPFTAWRSVYADTAHKEWDVSDRLSAGESPVRGFIFKSTDEVQSVDWWLPSVGAPVRREYKSTRLDSVVDRIEVDPTTGQIQIFYHNEDRTLDLVMVLKSRSLQ